MVYFEEDGGGPPGLKALRRRALQRRAQQAAPLQGFPLTGFASDKRGMRWVEFAYYWGLVCWLGVLCMAAPGTEPTLTGMDAKERLRADAAKSGNSSGADGGASGRPAKTGGTAKVPGPRGLPYVGTSFMASWDPMGRLAKWARKYGDVVYYRFFNFHVYVLFHPRDVEKVLLGKTEAFSKGITSQANPELFGNGLLTSDGEFWRRQRRLSNPAFHRESILRYAEITTEEAERLLGSWKSGETRNIHNDMMNVTLRTVLRSLFGGELGEGMGVIEPALEAIMRASTGFYSIAGYLGVPSRTRTRYFQALAELDRVVYGLIARGRERLASGAVQTDRAKDLLTLLLMARDDDGNSMTDRQLRDEVITLLLAGHETTALHLSWTWYLLAQHPEVEAKLHAELDSVLQGRVPCASDIPKLVYTERVLREVLRLYPPAWRIFRRTQDALEVGGYTLPAGANLVMSQWVTQRDSRWFAEAERFDPDRWSEERAAKVPRFAYFPFGGGPRVCIGAGFAMMEATLLLAAIAQRYRMRMVKGKRVETLGSITLRPKDGVWVELEGNTRGS